MRIAYGIVGLAGIVLAGCAASVTAVTPPGTSATIAVAPSGPLASLQTFTVADLQAADTDAKSQNPPDVLAAQCYEGLIPFIQTGISLPNPGKPVGVVSAFQDARDVAKAGLALSTGLTPAQKTELAQACGPLALDSVTDLNGALVKIGIGTVNTSLLGGL